MAGGSIAPSATSDPDARPTSAAPGPGDPDAGPDDRRASDNRAQSRSRDSGNASNVASPGVGAITVTIHVRGAC
jgi:hypothetical protein